MSRSGLRRLLDRSPIDVRSPRDRVARALQRRLAPAPDASPVTPGRGPQPLGRADLPAFATPALAELGDLALAAGRGEAVVLPDLTLPADGPVERVALRLVHLAAVHAWSRLSDADAERLGGAARAHARFLVRERPVAEGDLDAALVDAALVIAGYAFPALDDAAGWRGTALARLGHSLPAALRGGAPSGSPAHAARTLWAVALARAWASASDAALPSPALTALVEGVSALDALAGDSGPLPGEPPPPALLPLSAGPAHDSLWDLLLAWGLVGGAPRRTADDAVQRLAGRVPTGTPQDVADDDTWRLWSWRESGVAVAHARIKGHAGRVSLRTADGLLSWDLDGAPLIWSTRAGTELTVTRVDGAKTRIIAVDADADPLADGRAERDVLVRQARLLVTDLGRSELHWRLGQAWQLVPGDKPDTWTAEHDGHTLLVKLEHDGWAFRVDGDRIDGSGDPGTPVRTIVELR